MDQKQISGLTGCESDTSGPDGPEVFFSDIKSNLKAAGFFNHISFRFAELFLPLSFIK